MFPLSHDGPRERTNVLGHCLNDYHNSQSMVSPVFYSVLVRYYVIQNVHCEDNTWLKVQDIENHASLSVKNNHQFCYLQFHTPSNQ